MKPASSKKAIAANIEAMRDILVQAVVTASEGVQAITKGDQNQAIGAIIDIDRELEYALALYRAAIALHRAGRPL